MTIGSRYHVSLVRCFLLIAVFSLWAVALQAQVNGPRPSVTSLGGPFDFSNPPGPRASVTSVGPNGWGPGPCCRFPHHGPARPGFSFDNRHHRGDGSGWAGGYPVYVMPYYYPMDVIDPVDTSMEQSYASGPTIFDRRGPDQSSGGYEQRVDERLSRLEQQIDEAEQAKPTKPVAEASAIPALDQPDTVLVFRDGHNVTVKNYVIAGDTLYDYSSAVRRKIDLAELDVAATQKKNDDRGVDFRLPAHVAAK